VGHASGVDITAPSPPSGPSHANERHQWTALFITTLGMLMATIDASIVLIALPDIFRGIHLDPLLPSNSFFLLWMILGFLITTSVLVVSFGRLGDLYGRVRMYNLGFAVFTFFSLLLSITWMTGTAAGIWLIVMRIFQGVGAALLMANSAAILTDAFPPGRRGFALGITQAAAISGTFIGLLLGGLLAPINWRLVFLVSVPIGLFATVWGYFSLHEIETGSRARIDWAGNVTFALGLILIMIGITYGIEPYGGHPMGWTNPVVLLELAAGVAFLIVFCIIEVHTDEPMFRLQLFRIRAFSAGVFASFLGSLGRGGLMFMLIIWLQGIWLPIHGYTFEVTPLWAGISLIPLTAGFLLAGPVSGILSDRFGSRPFATFSMLATALCLFLFTLLPIDFSYTTFAVLLFFTGMCMSTFGSSNRTGVMNSLPARDRGAGSGMSTTFQNSAQVLSIGIFFSLIILGLADKLPSALVSGLTAHGVPTDTAVSISHLPPVSTLFAAFLGYNPAGHLIGHHILSQLTPAQRATITGDRFFPSLITDAFRAGLHTAFNFAAVMCLAGAGASWTRGGKSAPCPVEDEPAIENLVPEPAR
jgi:MFS family permease